MERVEPQLLTLSQRAAMAESLAPRNSLAAGSRLPALGLGDFWPTADAAWSPMFEARSLGAFGQ